MKKSAFGNLLLTVLFVFSFSKLFGQTSIDWKLMSGPKNGDGTYARLKKIFFDNKGVLYALSYESGLYFSTNRSQSWTRRQPAKSEGYIDFWMAFDTNYNVLLATEKGVFRYNKSADSWADLNDLLPDSKVLAVGVTQTGTIYIVLQSNDIYFSTDNGTNWAKKNQGTNQNNSYPGLYAGYGSEMFLSADRMLKTNDQSQNWSTITSLPGIYDYLRVASTIYVSGGSNDFYLSTNKGISFTKVYSTSPGPGTFTIDKKGKLWASDAPFLYTSTDNGHSWKSIGTNFEPAAMTCDSLNFLFATYENGGSDPGIIRTVLPVASVSDEIRNSFQLYTYPNPFTAKTTFSFTLPQEEFTTLKIYNPLGTEIVTLVNQRLPAGDQRIEFDASHLPSGVYYYRLQIGGEVETKTLVVAH